jgi:hypothetical protein
METIPTSFLGWYGNDTNLFLGWYGNDTTSFLGWYGNDTNLKRGWYGNESNLKLKNMKLLAKIPTIRKRWRK